MNVGRRKRLAPMPIEPILDNPRYMRLPAGARGMLHSLVYHFWLTDCAPLPRDDDSLFAIARAHRPTWRTWKPELLEIFAEIAPILERSNEARRLQHESLRRLADKGRAASEAKRLAAKANTSAQSPLSFATPKRREERQAEIVARREAIRKGFAD